MSFIDYPGDSSLVEDFNSWLFSSPLFANNRVYAPIPWLSSIRILITILLHNKINNQSRLIIQLIKLKPRRKRIRGVMYTARNIEANVMLFECKTNHSEMLMMHILIVTSVKDEHSVAVDETEIFLHTGIFLDGC
ncbi:hypothetical protein NW756_011061 [Fusarium oxysporum]|nr:hypothetical protein NW763_012409 [Fusarium oxysporum]KAJ4043506.1 hypothetical protein NW753_010103 [Fusarium oxysporum]KAJ4080100.1 hypothetical protein NW756_011061 [Fusarium oxysporum]